MSKTQILKHIKSNYWNRSISKPFSRFQDVLSVSSLFLIPSSLFKHTFQSLNPFDLKPHFSISGCSVRVFPAGGHQAWLPLAAQWAEDALQVS